MEHMLDKEILALLKREKQRKRWRKILSALMCIVVFCTTYALILPAITQETETFCGLEAHAHEDACYEQILSCQTHIHTDGCYEVQSVLICPGPESHAHLETCEPITETSLVCDLEETEGHTHTEACVGQEKVLVCTEETAGHTHTDACSPTTQTLLTCTLEESAGHTHTEACMVTEQILSCTQEESEDHFHGEACYSTVVTYSCNQEESAGHTHAEGCYSTITTYGCGLEESAGHSHAETCYETVDVYVCGQEETAGHTHTEACYTSVTTCSCDLESHTDLCYEVKQVLTCALEEDADHVHGDDCYEKNLICQQEEHEHTLICYSDPTADVETAAVWEATLPKTLSGVYADDVLAIAKSQLGYAESTRNYTISDDGRQLGYTRYGQWYGYPYGDWCAMFVSFCISYAEVEGIPLEASCPEWITLLEEQKMYLTAAEYTPAPGDLIFFDWNENGISDHVGLIEAVTPADEHSAATISTIEGNSGDSVRYNTYNLADTRIMGYGLLPGNAEENPEQYTPIDVDGTALYHSPEHSQYQYSSHRLDDQSALTYVLIPYEERDTWRPSTKQWSADTEANYVVAYAAAMTEDAGQDGAPYTAQKIQESETYGDHAEELAGIVTNSYPFITAERMRQLLTDAYNAGETELDLSCCVESEYLAAAQWAIWDTTQPRDEQAIITEATFPERNAEALNPLENVGHTDAGTVQSHVAAIRDWLMTKRAPLMLQVAQNTSQLTRNADGTYALAVTVTFDRPLEEKESLTGALLAGSHSAPISLSRAGEDTVVVTLDGLSAEEAMHGQVSLDVTAERLRVYAFDGGMARDMIGGQWGEETYNLSFDIEQETVDIAVQKQWSGDEIGADYVEVQLYADGEKQGDLQRLSSSNQWRYVWENQLKYSQPDKEIQYEVREVLVPGYQSSVSKLEDTDLQINFLITNTKTEALTSVSVTKEWAGRSDEIYPESVQINLLQNGEIYGETVTLSQENSWSYCWEEIPLQIGQTQYVYTVEEVAIKDYTVTVETTTAEDGTTHFHLCNTWTPEYVPVQLTKTDLRDPGIQLSGARFQLYLKVADTYPDAVDIPQTEQIKGSLAGEFRTDQTGQILIENLLLGETYYLVETGAPDGYAFLEEPVIIQTQKDEENQVLLTVLSDEQWAQNTGADENGCQNLRICNEQIYLLPKTGGSGTYLYTAVGLLLMLCSIAYLMYIPQKRRKEVP